MIATAVGSLYATQKLREDGLSHCSQPRAGWRVVEHSDYTGRPTRVHAVRPVSEESEHRAQHAAAPLNALVAAAVLGRRRYSQRHRATNIVSLTSGAIFARCSSRWLRWATGTSLLRAQAYCSLTKYRSRSSIRDWPRRRDPQ